MTEAIVIDRPGLYEIPEDVYHSDPVIEPSLSASLAKVLLSKSPRHAWTESRRLNPYFEPTNKAAFDLGHACHAMLLGSHEEFAVIEASDWRTKAAKEAREDAYNAGKVPLLAKHWAEVEEMINAARAQLAVHEDCRDPFVNGKPEQTLVWQDGGVWCRCRLDWLPNAGNVFIDYKSTSASAHPDAFQRTVYQLGYDVQAAFYRRGIRSVLKISDPIFWFIVQETEEPYALSVIGLTPAATDFADRKIDKALQWWRWCLDHDTWPGYPNRTAYIDPPAWVEKQQLEEEMRDQMTREAGNQELFKRALDWQRPLTGDAT